MIAPIAKRGAIFAVVTFTMITVIDSLGAGTVTLAIIRRAAAIAIGGALAYSVIRFIIAWANQ